MHRILDSDGNANFTPINGAESSMGSSLMRDSQMNFSRGAGIINPTTNEDSKMPTLPIPISSRKRSADESDSNSAFEF